MLTSHVYTSEEKMQLWGYGEWVEEPDYVAFFKYGFHCRLYRLEHGSLYGCVSVHHDSVIFNANNLDLVINIPGIFIEKNEEVLFVSFSCENELLYKNIAWCIDICEKICQNLVIIKNYLEKNYRLD